MSGIAQGTQGIKSHQELEDAGQEEDEAEWQLDAGTRIVQALPNTANKVTLTKSHQHAMRLFQNVLQCIFLLFRTSQTSPRNFQKGRVSSLVMKYGRPAAGDPNASFSAACIAVGIEGVHFVL